MATFDEDPEERATIADLEVYGLPVRLINALDRHGILYVDQVEGMGVLDFRQMGSGHGNSFGPGGVALLRRVLIRWREGEAVRSVESCVAFGRGRVSRDMERQARR